jgi:DNA-binding CsgD family transcriptional regulator
MQADRLEEAVEVAHLGREAVLRLGLSGYWHDTFLLGSAAEALFKLGRWDEANRLAQQALAQARSDERLAFLMIAALEVGRGEFDAAEAHLSTVEDRVLDGSREFTRMYLVLVAELRIWQGRFDAAWEAVEQGLDLVARTDEARSGRLVCLGMRALADLAEHGRARHDPARVKKAVHAANALVSRVATMVPNPLVPDAAPVPSTAAVVALWDGERSRLEGRSDPVRWDVAAAAWSALRRPYPTAYAQYRQAEALLANRAPRAQAAEPLRAAHTVAVRLGATPLRRELELLAQRGRIQLEPPADPAIAVPEAPSAAASLGLTRREAEVLALVAEGRTNRQIGQALFITPKTASVHVSRILAKLGVAGRGEAAAIAHRLGLDKQ